MVLLAEHGFILAWTCLAWVAYKQDSFGYERPWWLSWWSRWVQIGSGAGVSACCSHWKAFVIHLCRDGCGYLSFLNHCLSQHHHLPHCSGQQSQSQICTLNIYLQYTVHWWVSLPAPITHCSLSVYLPVHVSHLGPHSLPDPTLNPEKYCSPSFSHQAVEAMYQWQLWRPRDTGDSILIIMAVYLAMHHKTMHDCLQTLSCLIHNQHNQKLCAAKCHKYFGR